MKEPKGLSLRTGHYNSLSLSHLDDTGKCYLGTASYGEHTHASLTKSEVKKVLKWLTRWMEFKDANCTKDDGGQDGA